MGPVEALKIALKKEESSIKLYQRMYLRYPELKELVSFLINQEEKHKQMVEKAITKIISA